MASKSIKRFGYFLLILLIFILSRCANQLPPGGGAVDKTPPEIINVYPSNGTINYDDNYFELEFSEYIEKRSLQDAIFISPAIEGSLELDWSGRSVQVNFPSDLKSNTTYVITIGTDIVDYNNKNRMAESFNFIFSTGNEIDKKIISGRVFDDKPEGVLIYAYKINSDTIDPFSKKPEFISQAGNNGNFKLLGLSEGDYRIFAVKDEFRDLLFQPDQDLIGMPFKDISFEESDTLFENLNFFLTKIDTVKPRILSASMTDRNHILINFSEEIDSSSIDADNFFIIDSTSGEIINPFYAYKGNTKQTEMVLVANENFQQGKEYFLAVDSVKDQYGNVFYDDLTQLTISDRPDTVKLNIHKIESPANSNNVDFINPDFTFYFNDGFNTQELDNKITFRDTVGRNIPFNIIIKDDAAIVIKPEENLDPDKYYLIKIDLSELSDAAGNISDTAYTYRFKTISGLDFTGITGKISNIEFSKNPVLILNSLDKKFIYKKYADKQKFEFTRVQPGEYLLWCYFDEDSSNSYTNGWPYPFRPSEEFSYYNDTLSLRARWVQTDINFIFKGEK